MDFQHHTSYFCGGKTFFKSIKPIENVTMTATINEITCPVKEIEAIHLRVSGSSKPLL